MEGLSLCRLAEPVPRMYSHSLLAVVTAIQYFIMTHDKSLYTHLRQSSQVMDGLSPCRLDEPFLSMNSL